MSTLSATNLKNASSGSNNIVLGTSGQTTVNGDLQFNSGYGSAATAYGCRAWVNFNGTGTVAIRASGNVSSITDNGVGDYTVNFTTALADANYAVTTSLPIADSLTSTRSGQTLGVKSGTTPGTGSVTIVAKQGASTTQNAAQFDTDYAYVAIFR